MGYKSMSGMPPVAKLSFSSHNAQVFKHDWFIPILVYKLTMNRICLIVLSCTNLSIKILTLFSSSIQHPIILVDPEGVGGGGTCSFWTPPPSHQSCGFVPYLRPKFVDWDCGFSIVPCFSNWVCFLGRWWVLTTKGMSRKSV